jgi:hypothetical protein
MAYSNNTVDLSVDPVRPARQGLPLDPGVCEDFGTQGSELGQVHPIGYRLH